MAPVPEEGTLVFGVKCDDKEWATNSQPYSFGTFRRGLLQVTVMKHGDVTFELVIEGLGPQSISTRRPIPHGEFPGVQVVIVWRPSEVEFYLNGQCVDTVKR
jgi:hypothetical protein